MAAVIDGLAAALLSLWAPLAAADDLLDVVRGAPVGGYDAERMLLVEHDASPDAETDSRFDQEWTDLAQTTRLERGEIVCSVVVQSGDDDVAAAESSALAIAGTAHQLLVTGRPALYAAAPGLGSCQVTAGSARQLQNTRGVAAFVPFTVAYAAIVT